MNIQVDTSQLNQKSNEIRSLKIDLLNTMDQIELLVLSVNGGWQGDAERAFSEKILTVYADGIFQVGKERYSKTWIFTDINYAVASKEDKTAMFLDYSELLKNFAYTYEQQESDLSSKINLA